MKDARSFFWPKMTSHVHNNTLTSPRHRGRVSPMTRQVYPDFPVAFLSGALPGGSRLKRGGNL